MKLLPNDELDAQLELPPQPELEPALALAPDLPPPELEELALALELEPNPLELELAPALAEECDGHHQSSAVVTFRNTKLHSRVVRIL